MKFLSMPDPEGDKSSYMENRKYVLLRVSLVLVAGIGIIFSILNFYRGLFFIAAVEAAVFLCCCLILIFLYLRPQQLSLASTIFVVMSFALGVTASTIKAAHPTIFIWIGLGPLFAFFLLGARRGFLFSVFTVPLCAFLFLHSHPDLPLVAYLNVILFISWVVALALYYELTRAETEKALIRDIEERHRKEEALRQINSDLREALDQIKTLQGLLPICASCKKIRDDKGHWEQMEIYIRNHSDAEFSHGICPDCAKTLYPELYREE